MEETVESVIILFLGLLYLELTSVEVAQVVSNQNHPVLVVPPFHLAVILVVIIDESANV